jgi:hypothetical protein
VGAPVNSSGRLSEPGGVVAEVEPQAQSWASCGVPTGQPLGRTDFS